MKPSKIWANLVVDDVERTRKFYTQLGFRPNAGYSNELASFIVGENDFVVHFFAADGLHPAYRDEIAAPTSSNELMFTLSGESREEVNAWAEEVRSAGGTIFSAPQLLGGNFYGFAFSDPDGHKWNVFYM